MHLNNATPRTAAVLPANNLPAYVLIPLRQKRYMLIRQGRAKGRQVPERLHNHNLVHIFDTASPYFLPATRLRGWWRPADGVL